VGMANGDRSRVNIGAEGKDGGNIQSRPFKQPRTQRSFDAWKMNAAMRLDAATSGSNGQGKVKAEQDSVSNGASHLKSCMKKSNEPNPGRVNVKMEQNPVASNALPTGLDAATSDSNGQVKVQAEQNSASNGVSHLKSCMKKSNEPNPGRVNVKMERNHVASNALPTDSNRGNMSNSGSGKTHDSNTGRKKRSPRNRKKCPTRWGPTVGGDTGEDTGDGACRMLGIAHTGSVAGSLSTGGTHHKRSKESLGNNTSNPATSSQQTDNLQARVKVEENHRASNIAPGLKSCLRRSAEEPPSGVEPSNSHGSSTNSATANNFSHGTAAKVAEPNDVIHLVFAIDFSSSMKMRDVKTSKGNISRWEAVFECIDTLLTQQLRHQEQSGMMCKCLVSVFIFNDESQVLLKRVQLTGEGNDVRNELKKARKAYTPIGGTGFAAGMKRAKLLTHSRIHDKVVLVFLSDGRPGDLRSKPPSEPTTAMQTTFKRNGVTYPSAGHYIESMKKRHTDFNLQLICLYNEGADWLKYLAEHYNGTFHNPDLALDDVAVAPQPCAPGHSTQDNDGDSEEEVLEMKVKSAATLIRERRERARAAGDILSLTNTSTNASSIRSTFSSISATVTAMRSGTKQLQERQVIIKSESAMISYESTRMVLITDANGIDKFTVAIGERANERKVSVSMHPFAQGGLRNVYRMKQKLEQRQVAKESRHDIKYSERLKFHLETVKCQAQAMLYASYFNKRIKITMKKTYKQGQQPHSLADVPRIDVLRAEVYRLKAASCPGGFRYLAVEKEMPGQYLKWNNNDGFVNQSNCLKCQVAQAYSHFSYEESEQQKMVVDIQGTGTSTICMYTDPQLHSVEKEFGRADRGTVGIDKFFSTHKCNFICQELNLPQRYPTI